MNEAYVGLGSNQSTARGDAAAQLEAALDALRATSGLVVDAVSPLYWTEPQDMGDQPWFANKVVRLLCAEPWTAQDLLRHFLAVETALGRVRADDEKLRFGPRVIDMDLLLFGKESSHDPLCILPHPRMMQRAFVLVPLRDIAPGVILHGDTTIDQALAQLHFRVQGQHIYQEV